MFDGKLMLKHGVFDRPYDTQQLFAGGTNEHKNNTLFQTQRWHRFILQTVKLLMTSLWSKSNQRNLSCNKFPLTMDFAKAELEVLLLN